MKRNSAVIFDFNRTLYDPDTGELVAGARKVLDDLRARSIPLYLVSKKEEGRARILEDLGVKDAFAEIFYVSEKSPALFLKIAKRAGLDPADIFVVGDYLHKEIRSGNIAGMKTIHFKQGKFSGLEPETPADNPWRTIINISDSVALILSGG